VVDLPGVGAVCSPSADTVAVVTTAAKLGGAERSLLALASALPAQGVRPMIIGPPGEVIKAAIDAGVSVRQVPLTGRLPVSARSSGRRRYPVIKVIKNLSAKLADAARVRQALVKEKPSLVHSNNLPSHLPVIIAAKLCRTPVTLHLREITAVGPGRRALGVMAKSVGAVVAISTAVAATVPSARVVTVFNPVPGPDTPVTLKRRLPSELPTIGYIGRIDPRKGVHDAVALAHELACRVRVVGDLQSAPRQYVRLLDRLATLAPGRVEFAGPTDEPYHALAGFDVLVVPSREEPFGRVAAEAQRLGVPVVAANRAGLLDVVIDGESGLTYPPGDVQALARRVSQLLEDDDLRAKVVAGGKRSARRFDADKHAHSMAQLFAAVVQR
jgi:glycosyltransferase involved in cell wall biosynthesis